MTHHVWKYGLLCLVGLVTHSHADTCSVASSLLAFGTYSSPNGVLKDSATTIAVTCLGQGLLGLLTCPVAYSVSLSTGNAGGYSPRRLNSGANTLQYNIYTNVGRTTVWGNGTGGSSSVPGSASSAGLLACQQTTTNHTVYGRIPALQNVPAGGYSDTIIVTVTY